MNDFSAFEVSDLDNVLTPCLAVSPRMIRNNLMAMIQTAGGASNLRPHVKTHKCPEIVRMAMQLGITKHKCATLAEAEMLAQLVDDVLVAYPVVGPNVLRLVQLVAEYPQVRFSVLVDCARAAELVSSVFSAHGQSIDVLIDMNVGMNRTGIQASSDAVQLAQVIHSLPALRLVGLHVYDGHNHQPNLGERSQAVEGLMKPVIAMVGELKSLGIAIESLICGGTPTFPVFARWSNEHQADPNVPKIVLSPGTSVLSDYNYGRDFPDVGNIQPAAVLLTRVVSKPSPGLITVDLGHKAVAADQPAGRRCHFVDLPDAEELKHSEEHLVIRTSAADSLQVGQLLRVQPAHICPTVALHEQLVVIEDGHVQGLWPVCRHRIYTTA